MQKNDPMQQKIDEVYKEVELDDILVTIRSFRYDDTDYEAVIAIENALEPERPAAVEALQHRDQTRNPKYLFERFLVEQDEQLVAISDLGHAEFAHRPGKYSIDVRVHPEYQNQGIGSALYDYLFERLAPRQPVKLVSSTREDREVSIQFLERRGFRQVMRTPLSRLDSATFDPSRFADKVARTLDSGIVIKTVRQLSETDPDYKRKLYELGWECIQDVPRPDPVSEISFEEFDEIVFQDPRRIIDAWFVALDGDHYVGTSDLLRYLVTDGLLHTGLTGVLRSHRRRGIATALKVHAIQYAQRHGNATIITDNEENNPMFQLNLELGFVPQPAKLIFEKRLSE